MSLIYKAQGPTATPLNHIALLTLYSMVIKSGCSASMLCLNEAFRALQSRECSSAIVAGTNLIMTPTMTINMSEQGAVSPTGSCKTFDAQADGYARGEAINALYLKPLDTAIRDRDPIRAVIRAVATNVDGKTVGISNPNPEAQEALIRMTYDMAGITDLSQTAFVECHGTGTVVGDPLETHAVANAFGDQGVYIGSVGTLNTLVCHTADELQGKTQFGTFRGSLGYKQHHQISFGS